MKKYLLLNLALIFCTTCAFATGNPSDKYKKNISYPSTQSYTRTQTPTSYPTTKPSSENSKKAQLDSVARQMLKAAQNHQDISSYQKKFMDLGATGMCPPQVISKRTPKCPPIKINVNGRSLSGSTCAITCYEYEGKQYDVGFCK